MDTARAPGTECSHRTQRSRDAADIAFWLGLGTVIPLLVWWLGWFPGFLSKESLEQLAEVEQFRFTSLYPPIHTIALWAGTRLWNTPGAVALLQVLAMVLLLATVSRRLTRLGMPVAVAVGTVWAVSSLPAVGSITVAVWSDVAFALALVWTFVELLALARLGDAFWANRANQVRLGSALALVWLLRRSGPLTVVLLAFVFLVVYRDRLRSLAVSAGVLVATVLFVQAILYSVFPVDRVSPAVGDLYPSVVASSLTHEQESFSASELAYLETIAPLDVWTGAYLCEDGSALIKDRDFDPDAIRREPRRFRSLMLRSVVRDPDTALGHRLCAASFLFIPRQPLGGVFERVPYAIPANDLGLERSPVSDGAFRLTKAILVRTEQPDDLWLWWRPGLLVWLAMATYVALAVRRRFRLLWPGAAFAAHLVALVVTAASPAFRYALGIYLISLLSLPLALMVFRSKGVPQTASTQATTAATRAGSAVPAGASMRTSAKAS
ncbi:MAG: hypothetical protein ACE5KX_04160 [Acidimicrobiia bacterium]